MENMKIRARLYLHRHGDMPNEPTKIEALAALVAGNL